MKYLITDIEYDTDGADVNLPKKMEIEVSTGVDDENVEDFLSDKISNETGFCHNGFTFSELK